MDVFIFGAGASAPYGVPVMRDFLLHAFRGWLLLPKCATSYEPDLDTVAALIDKCYGSNLGHLDAAAGGLSPQAKVSLSKINLEELMSLAKEEADRGCLRALERVIYKTIESSCENLRSHCYERLARFAIQSGRRTCLISFNYDLLLDHALNDAGHNLSAATWSYGMNFAAGIQHFNSYQGAVTDPQIYLLKLHGSLNWARCRKCNGIQLWYHRNYDSIASTSWPNCVQCDAQPAVFEPVLIAPTAEKCYPSAIEDALRIAAHCLSEAEHITIVGYSFPVSDLKSRLLFLRNAIIPNAIADVRPDLIIVDTNEPMRKTIRDWFSAAVNKDVEEYCSFEKYCERLDSTAVSMS